MSLEATIDRLLEQSPLWGDVIRTCIQWAEDKGADAEFVRQEIYHRLGHLDDRGPRLTPLEDAGIIEKHRIGSDGTPAYVLAQDRRELLDALTRASARVGARRPA